VRLNELYLLQELFEKRLILKAGRLDAGNDFLSSPLYWQYVNNAFDGNPISIFFNIPFTAYPGATWGAIIGAEPWEWLDAKFAVYNANSKIQQNKYHGTNFTFSSTNGVVWITEWDFSVNQSKCHHGMPGNYKVGFFYLTGDEPKFSGGKQRGDPGLYFLLDQMVYRHGGAESNRGLTPFISLMFQPKNRNLFPFFVDGGLVYRGPFESRPKDVAAFGVAHGHYSSDLASVQRKTGAKPQHGETVLELNYWFQINKWFYIMPDMQYIIQPKGLSSTPNAYVIGFQLGLDQW
jgi:porin